MKKIISEAFGSENLEVGFARFCDVRFEKADSLYKTVLITYLPYYFPECGDSNICKYASLPDYHKFFAEKLLRVAEKLNVAFPENKFDVYVDKSPVDEKKAAIIAGLGFKGQNSLLITEKHGSFVFLGSICTDIDMETIVHPERMCERCGLCVKNCPVHALDDGYLDIKKCLSAVTQRKGELTDDERVAIEASGVAWGCDVCQNVCPHNVAINDLYSAFAAENKNDIISHLAPEDIETLTEKQFQAKYSGRAFVWRGRKTLLRDLEIVKNKTRRS